jgi:hypothetical protein
MSPLKQQLQPLQLWLLHNQKTAPDRLLWMPAWRDNNRSTGMLVQHLAHPDVMFLK